MVGVERDAVKGFPIFLLRAYRFYWGEFFVDNFPFPREGFFEQGEFLEHSASKGDLPGIF